MIAPDDIFGPFVVIEGFGGMLPKKILISESSMVAPDDFFGPCVVRERFGGLLL